MKSKIRNSLLAGTVGLTVMSGCERDPNVENYFHKTAEVDGFSSRAHYGVDGRTLVLSEISNDGNPLNIASEPYLLAKDKFDYDRFDEVKLYNVPQGHDLENFVDLEELERIFEYVEENGEVYK